MALVVVGVILPWAMPSSGAVEGAAYRDCCPTLQRDAHTGALALRIPPASIVTLLGGIALVTAHVANLRSARGRCASHGPKASS